MIDATTLQAAFAGFTCERMTRAWRNRSNVTQGHWSEKARTLRGPTATLGEVAELAAVLYVACSELCGTDRLDPAAWRPVFWKVLARRVPRYLVSLPTEALQRGAYETARNKP